MYTKSLKKSIFIIFTTLIFGLSAQAQTKLEPNQIADLFFANLKSKGVSVAIDSLYATNKWMDIHAESMVNLKKQMESLNVQNVGPLFGYDLIFEKSVTKNYVYLSYLVKYERVPLRFNFQFYKPNNDWVFFSFRYDPKIDEDLEEASKEFYKKL